MADHEKLWDQRLQIQTTGRDDTRSDTYRYPYEPTPYCVLERLAHCGLLEEGHVLLDYGCGKGRVGFFLSCEKKLSVLGIEYDPRIYALALENQKTAHPKAKVNFLLTRAETYLVPEDVDRCYFFNPFSVELLQKVMARILDSYYACPREIFLFFYYPCDEYVAHLMGVDALDFYDDIWCGDLFEGNDPRERILIFRLPH